ncbi:MAG: C-type lectin domain-containing protein [Vicinamibacterales bacterium]
MKSWLAVDATGATSSTTPALAAAAILLAISTAAQALPLTGPVVNPANGHTYYLLDAGSWQDSETEATGLGGHLVTISDAAEQDWVFSTFGGYAGVNRSLWIGLNDQAVEGSFVWSSGEAVGYTNWAPFEPNDFQSVEDFVHMLRTGNGFGAPAGFWNDIVSPNTYTEVEPIHGIVEVGAHGDPGAAAVPEPASLVLLGSGLLALRLRRRR